MRRLALLLLVAVPLFGQELFPRFSITGSTSKSDFETNIRVDPEVVGGEVGTPGTGTVVNFERDLGLDDSRNLQRFGLQWSPARRHEFSATYFSAPRNGFAQIDREILFREKLYPVNAQVTSQLDLDYLSASYTYWLRRTDHDGLGLSLGAAMLSLGASVNAVTADQSVTLSESADTDVPVLLVGAQGRVALTNRIYLDGGASTLPRVTINGYTGDALTANAKLEYRALPWLGIGAAYQYFRLDVDVARTGDLTGSLDMTIRGPEAYLRLAF